MGIFSILSALTGLIDPVGRIVGQIADARERADKAKSDSERIAMEERVASLKARKDVIIARSDHPLDALIRNALGLIAVIFCAKLYVIDKVLGMGSTDPLSSQLWDVLLVIIGGYFVHGAARVLRR